MNRFNFPSKLTFIRQKVSPFFALHVTLRSPLSGSQPGHAFAEISTEKGRNTTLNFKTRKWLLRANTQK